MSLPIMNGCKVSQVTKAGSDNICLGEIENQSGHYKVWRQNPHESTPVWEVPFTNYKDAAMYSCAKVIEFVLTPTKES